MSAPLRANRWELALGLVMFTAYQGRQLQCFRHIAVSPVVCSGNVLFSQMEFLDHALSKGSCLEIG
jgi:hypothetical protein